jgi:hypothetical protein
MFLFALVINVALLLLSRDRIEATEAEDLLEVRFGFGRNDRDLTNGVYPVLTLPYSPGSRLVDNEAETV